MERGAQIFTHSLFQGLITKIYFNDLIDTGVLNWNKCRHKATHRLCCRRIIISYLLVDLCKLIQVAFKKCNFLFLCDGSTEFLDLFALLLLKYPRHGFNNRLRRKETAMDEKPRPQNFGILVASCLSFGWNGYHLFIFLRKNWVRNICTARPTDSQTSRASPGELENCSMKGGV